MYSADLHEVKGVVMVQLIILAALVYFGARAERLSVLPFGLIVIGALGAVFIESGRKNKGLAALGEPANMFEPEVFAGNTAITATLWGMAYLIGFGVGYLRRRGKQ